MKAERLISLAATVYLAASPVPVLAQASVGTAFTYQGRLKFDGTPITDTADFEFTLWDDPNSVDPGDQVGSTQFATVPVNSGLFTAMLDFGSEAFNGDARWLEVNVNGTRLLPRQELTPTPYAQFSAGNWGLTGNAGTDPNSHFLGTSDVQPLVIKTAGLEAMRIDTAGNVGIGTSNPESPLHIAGGNANLETTEGDFKIGDETRRLKMGINLVGPGNGAAYIRAQGGVQQLRLGSGTSNVLTVTSAGVGIGTTSPGQQLTVAGTIESTSGGFKFPDGTTQTTAVTLPDPAWGLAGNAGTDPNSHFLGTTDNAPLELRVNGARALRIAPAPDPNDAPNLIAGYGGNTVKDGAIGATISGGGNPGDLGFHVNVVADNYGTVGGGKGNLAGDDDGDPTGGWYATVSGGQLNDATGSYATIGGGAYNDARGQEATVGGGVFNQATGRSATIPGGVANEASGNWSFAAGYGAWAAHEGAFVWADTTTAGGWPFTSVSANEFAVLCTGGARFVSAADPNSVPTAGVQLAAGGGSWSSISDRNAKENFQTVDPCEVLAWLKQIPITTWNYKSQDPSIRHIGPMAQDFYSAFAVGEDDKHIATVDADGVALAAIQGLYEIVQEKDAEIEALRAEKNAEIAQQQEQIMALNERLSHLEALLARVARQHEEDN